MGGAGKHEAQAEEKVQLLENTGTTLQIISSDFERKSKKFEMIGVYM